MDFAAWPRTATTPAELRLSSNAGTEALTPPGVLKAARGTSQIHGLQQALSQVLVGAQQGGHASACCSA